MNLMKSASRFLKKNGGTILAIGASVGVVLTAIETGKASIKAEKLIEMNSAKPAYTMKEKVQGAEQRNSRLCRWITRKQRCSIRICPRKITP